jgi:phosphoesterase RecJ-like protein
VALLLREENGRVKGSLRTNYDEVNVAKIAQNWGGGGHKKASGFSLPGRLARTEKGWKVIKENNY